MGILGYSPLKRGHARNLGAPVIYQIKSENGIAHPSLGHFYPKIPCWYPAPKYPAFWDLRIELREGQDKSRPSRNLILIYVGTQ